MGGLSSARPRRSTCSWRTIYSTLQTMSGSRFVGRYAQKVRTWENPEYGGNIGGWYNAKRKWMYLESIFIGERGYKDAA